jgi:bacillolysin
VGVYSNGVGSISRGRLVCLAATGGFLIPAGPWHVGTVSAGSEAGLRSELERSAEGRAKFATSAETGEVTFVGGSSDHPLDASGDGTPSEVARRFIDHYGPLFGVVDPKADLTELVELHNVDAASGNSAVRFQQRYRGVPVFGGEIAVQVDRDGSILSTSGEALPSIDVDVNAQVSAAGAAGLARDLTAKYDNVERALLSVSTPELWVYDPSLIGADGVPGTRLVWRMEVRTDLGNVDRLVLVDAHSGEVALQFSQREDAVVNRSVCTNNNVQGPSEICSSPVRTEVSGPYGGPGAAEVNSAFDLTGVTYDFYALLGRDSVDNNGLPLKSTVLFCYPAPVACPMQNAFWNGSQMVYGQGYASADDVVAHELTHGVTQFTSRLLYYAESGAINESISDVMGELVDLGSTVSGLDPTGDRWLVGEQLLAGANRSMSNPPSFNDPDKMTSPLFVGGTTDAHGVHTNSGVNNKAAFLIADGGTFNGQTVVGLGLDKTARIYYQVETTLLGPGSDYLDLFHVLPQACTNLIGTAGITAGDCAEVTKAVTATEMDKFPTTAGAHLTAPVCDAGTVQSSVLFNDNMEVNNGNWTTTSTTPSAVWGYFTGSSQSGVKSLFAPNVGLIALSSVQSTPTIAVPSGTTSYLRFDHSFEMDYDSGHFYDGGVVEYSVNGGSTWFDAVALTGTINGYNGALDSSFGNPLAGRQAFSGPSPGYQSTRINLSSLAGNNVRLRFRLGSDNSLVYPGWFVDDLAVYTCAAPPGPAAAFNPLVPGRLLDSRSGQATVDGQFNGIGVRGAGTVTALTVAGRGGVAGDAAAVVLNVTVTDAQGPGFVTVFPCGSAQPNASSLNYVVGSTVANAVIVKVGAGGQVCLFTQSPINLIADVNGYFKP